MAHFIIPLKGDDEDPKKTGDMKSWFFYYKWRPDDEDETHYPIGEDALPTLQTGDLVWFSMDRDLVGKMHVTGVVHDPFNDIKELWFNTQDCVPVVTPCRVPLDTCMGPLPLSLIEKFESACTKK